MLYYQDLGFTGTQIGLLTGLTPLITFISAPFWTGIADAKRRHRLIMSLAILIGALTLIVFPLLNVFLPIVLVVVVLNIFLAPVQPYADSASMFMLADEKHMYGSICLGRTLGYGLVAPIAGLVFKIMVSDWRSGEAPP